MSLWEYKVITSGKGGFATPALLEKFLNDLGRDEWEIIHYQSAPENALSFSGLARRTTQRDWTLQDAAAVAAKAEAEKLRNEFEAKFKAATSNAPAAAPEDKPANYLDEKVSPDDGFRKPMDISRDGEPESPDADEEKDEWDQLAEEDELPVFFDALKPHMRRNQRGPGMSAGVDFLAKKWDLSEEDVKGALVECGLQIPADENAKPVYVEYDGDIFWVNINRRGEIWINTREKPRPIFRVVQGTKITPEEPAEKAEAGNRKSESAETEESSLPAEVAVEPKPAQKNQKPSAPLPAGPELLEKVRPQMRRNRRGPGGSGSTSFLARALRTTEAELMTAFAGMGLHLPEKPGDKPLFAEFGDELWWLNRDQRGGVWINGREKAVGETVASATAAEPTPETAPAVAPDKPEAPQAEPVAATASTAAPDKVLAGVRLLLKPTKTGAVAGEVSRLAEALNKPVEEFVAALAATGLKVPEKAREKPVFVEHAGEIFWFNQNAKGQLWLNAKASKYADGKEGGDAGKPAKRSRSKKTTE
ncbi:MAG: hypothetical protein KA257_03040 [Opitutaceae bacterium]|nr:hypothetical protein [Opitutaceae bacterium]MBP9912008.1 hypothetical protein [Opitutaceae bacterium]